MATFGTYDVVQQIHTGPLGSVARARVAGDERHYAVKVFDPAMMGLLEADAATQAFLDRAALLKSLSERGAKNWAPIHELQTTDDGAYYVTDFYPLTAESLAQSLAESEAPLHVDALHAVVTSVVKGLLELRMRHRRAHGNLKASNVLIAGTAEDLAAEPAAVAVHLADVATEADTPAARAADLHALGELVHLLVLHRPFRAAGPDPDATVWPVPASPEWQQLGKRGEAWRDLCNWLLTPTPGGRPEALEPVVVALRDLAPKAGRGKRPRATETHHPRVRKRTVAVLLGVPLLAAVLAGSGAFVLRQLHGQAKYELNTLDGQWFGALRRSLADPGRRQAWRADPDLKAVVDEIEQAEAAGEAFDASRTPTLSLSGYRKTQSAVARVKRIRQALAPERWKRLGEAVALQKRYEARHWDQPAAFLADLVRNTQPAPGTDPSAGVDRFLRVAPPVAASAESVEQTWAKLNADLATLDKTGDKVLAAFAEYFRNATAVLLRLTDGGFEGLDGVKEQLPAAGQLAGVVAKGWPDGYGRDRFARDVESTLNTVQPKFDDVRAWLDAVGNYEMVQLDEKSDPVSKLAVAVDKLMRDVGRQGYSDADLVPFNAAKADLDVKIAAFRSAKFVKKDIAQGSGDLPGRWEGLYREVGKLRTQWVKVEDPKDWIESVEGSLAVVESDQVRGRWAAWLTWLKGRTDALAADPKAYAAVKKSTDDVRTALADLDQSFPRVYGLSQEWAAAAFAKREQSLAAATAWAVPADGVGLDKLPAPPDKAAAEGAAKQFADWCAKLKDLAKDFPLNKEVLAPDDRPDLKWAGKAPDFWNDKLVQGLVKPDVARIARLAEVAAAARDGLVQTAGSTSVPTEVATAAWRRLGAADDRGAAGGAPPAGKPVLPPWPTRPGELETELKLRKRMADVARGIKDPAAKDALVKDLAAQAPVRWRRFANTADDDETLREAASRQADFGMTDPGLLAQLDARARFNLSLFVARQAADDGTPGAVKAAADDLTNAVTGWLAKERPELGQLVARLPHVSRVEPMAGAMNNLPRGADGKPPAEFVLTIKRDAGAGAAAGAAAAPRQVRFVRLEPRGVPPFYLATTEVSLGTFIDLVYSAGAWRPANRLLGTVGPTGDPPAPRYGPQLWARPQAESLPIVDPRDGQARTWRWGNEAEFDFARPLRAGGGFNSHSLHVDRGDNPSEAHPMQQVPAQAALYAAALVNCRLPTAREWQAAYAAYEADRARPDGTTPADWNLRDQTWQSQYDYTRSPTTISGAPAAKPLEQWPNDGGGANPTGVFWPAQLPPPQQVTSRKTNDGILFFRTVDAAAPRDGGGTGGGTGAGKGPVFVNLVGNVAEFVCDDPQAFEAAELTTDRPPAGGQGPAGVRSSEGAAAFAKAHADRIGVIGGSALSAPELDFTKAYPVNGPAEPYADVGFRLAFTAPAAGPGERLKWVLADQPYLMLGAGGK